MISNSSKSQDKTAKEEAFISRKEVAELAGVSEATVSRVLNNVGPIKEETRRRVLEAASQIGYVPSALAQQFARRKSGNIGVVLPFVPKVRLFSTYYFSEILSGIGEAAQRFGYDLLLIFQNPGEPPDYAKLFRTQKIDACILLGSRDVPEERAALKQLLLKGHPFFLVNQHFGGEDFPSVDADHVNGSRMAVRHLLEAGRRKIAFLNGPPEFSNSGDRLEGYSLEMREAGYPVKKKLMFTGNYSRTSGYELAAAIGDGIAGGKIDAVFAANDRMAIGLMQGLMERGLKPREHYALVGYDDSDGSRLVSPRLSTIGVPFYEMGKLAAERLLSPEQACDERETENGIIRLPVTLIPRETT